MRAKFDVQEQTRGVRIRAEFRLDQFTLSPSGGEKFFCRFWTSAFCDVANWLQSEKVEHESTTTNLLLSNGIKIVSVLQRLHREIGRTTLTFKSVTNRQTDKHTNKKLNIFGHPSGE